MDANNKFTPYDSELFLMIESLTNAKPKIIVGENSYTMTVHIDFGIPIPKKQAIADAIAGRLGKRIISSELYDTDFCYRVAFGDDCGQIRDSVTFEDGDISDSNVFYDPATALRGLLVLEPNFERLVRFVGNGQWERKPDGTGIFHFLNASGTIYCDAPEGSYLIFVKTGLYRVATAEEMKNFAMI